MTNRLDMNVLMKKKKRKISSWDGFFENIFCWCNFHPCLCMTFSEPTKQVHLTFGK